MKTVRFRIAPRTDATVDIVATVGIDADGTIAIDTAVATEEPGVTTAVAPSYVIEGRRRRNVVE